MPTGEQSNQNGEVFLNLTIAQLSQIYTIGSNAPSKGRFLERVATKLYDAFIGKPLPEKIKFLSFCLYAVTQRIRYVRERNKITSAPAAFIPPASGASGLRVAVAVMGGLGDIMQQMPFLIKFQEKYQPQVLDLYLHAFKLDDRAKIVSSGLPFLRGTFEISLLENNCASGLYDLKIEMRHVLKYTVFNKERLFNHSAELASIIAQAHQRFLPYEFIFNHHPYFDGLFGRLMASYGMNAVEASGYFGGIPLTRHDRPQISAGTEAHKSIERFGINSRYITLHDGYDVNNKLLPGAERATRSWPVSHWKELAAILKKAHPDIEIVQIGTSKTGVAIQGVDHMLLDKTSLLEATSLIEGALLHIDTESGLIRVAWAMDTPAISIQGPTGTKFFQIGSTHTIVSEGCHDCWWIKSDWFSHCIRGFNYAECMHSILPELVADKALCMLATNNLSVG